MTYNRNKYIALLLCLFLGFIGIHHYYLGNYNRGVLYFFTSWSGAPGLCSLYDFYCIARMDHNTFNKVYNTRIEGTGTRSGLNRYVNDLEDTISRIDG